MPNDNPMRVVREALGLTVIQMAARLGTGPQSIYRWEEKGTLPTLWDQRAKFDRLAREAKKEVGDG